MPVPADTDYAEVEELRPMVSKPESSVDVKRILQRYLNASASMIDQNTRQPLDGYVAFSESASEIRHYDDILSESGYVPIDDLLTISAITRDGIAITTANYKLYPYNRGNGPATAIYFNWSASFPVDVFTGGGFYNFPFKGVGLGAIAVTGTWGYCTPGNRPPEIKEATLIQAAAMYRKVHMPSEKQAQAIRDPFKFLTDEVQMLIGRFIKEGGVGFS